MSFALVPQTQVKQNEGKHEYWESAKRLKVELAAGLGGDIPYVIFTEGSGWNEAKENQEENYGAGRGAEMDSISISFRGLVGGQEHWVGSSTPDSATTTALSVLTVHHEGRRVRLSFGSGLAPPRHLEDGC